MRSLNGFQKGVNLGGWISQFAAYDTEHFDTFITEKDIAFIAGLGFDHVRVPVDYNVLEDEEAYANDILRKIPYDSFGEQALVTVPLRMESLGDPVIKRSRPVGYETRDVMREYGYTDEQLSAL